MFSAASPITMSSEVVAAIVQLTLVLLTHTRIPTCNTATLLTKCTCQSTACTNNRTFQLCVRQQKQHQQEVLKAVRALEEVETELSKQKDALKEVRVTQKTVGENVARSRKALAEVNNLQRQSQRFEEKLGHLRKQAKVKAEASDAALYEMQSELSAEEVRDHY
jgi:uncharacterized protein (DUF3084 family)